MRVGPVASTTAAALFVALLAPAAAGAHLRTGTVAVGFGASVRAPSRTARAAYTVGVYQSDRALHLTVSRGHTVVVIGYLGEPLLRVGPAGVAVNLRSPTAAAAGLLPKAGRTSSSNSGWRLERGRRSVVWHDPRDQRLPRGMARASWSVPIVVDGRRAHVSGELWRVPRPTPWPWLLIAALFAVLGGAVGLRGDERRLRATCIALGVVSAAAAIIAAAAFAVSTYASPGTWIAGLDEFAFAAAGFGVLVGGPRDAHVPAGIGLGLLGLAVGLSKGEVFLYGTVLASLPGTVTRLAIALAIAAGITGPTLGGLFYVRAHNAAENPQQVFSAL